MKMRVELQNCKTSWFCVRLVGLCQPAC